MIPLLAASLLAVAPRQTSDEVEQKVLTTLGQMTLDEKIDILSGVDGFNERGVPRLGVPKLLFSDGPVGVRNFGPTTAYPAGVCLAAAFDPELANRFGVAIGRDARSRGVAAWLGPGVNLSRVPQNGRNFEYLGEDPYLASRTVVGIIKGVQSQGVVATVKHYAANNHENDRMVDSSEVDERVLRELYFKPFEAAVREANVWAVMCAYNKLNGVYCSENPFLLKQVLRNDWGFRGVLMSDWGAVHSTLPALKGGLDLEMPGPEFITREKVKPLLDDGQLKMIDIDEKVANILRMTYGMGFDKRHQKDPSIPADDPANEQAALQVAREGTVLLKNKGVLPLSTRRPLHILVVGPNADPAVTGGGGSSYTTPAEKVSLLEAVKKYAGTNAKVDFRPLMSDYVDRALSFRGFTAPGDGSRRGLLMERFNNQRLSGTPAESRVVRGIRIRQDGEGQGQTHYSVRWTGNATFDQTGTFLAAARSDDGIRVYLDDKLIIDDWNDHGEKVDTAPVKVEKGRTYKVRVEFYQAEGEAIAQFGFAPMNEDWRQDIPAGEIENADAIIAAVGFGPATESEGQDRPFVLPGVQEDVLEKLVALNPRVIVVNNSGAGVDMSKWVDKAGGILQAWYPGGIGNLAIGEILFGLTNPSGKLPTTFPRTLKGTYYEAAYPPVNHKLAYKEGLLIGYRWFDTHNVAPLFPFGFGLSYTTFRFSHADLEPDRAHGTAVMKVTVENTGRRDGAETVQVYVHARDSKVARPEKELKGFARVFLKAGERKDVFVPIKVSDLSYWDTPGHKWVSEPGRYDVMVGDSSRNLPLKSLLTIQ
ncbi:MAG TPA: glycoside hydrolase family 3 C-terminal domain-containing protein [Fimbriimonas sp.]|nr:glycoside hydrolase family 3 C-terminal domain-containing protein [Fimbriimonas sp.]